MTDKYVPVYSTNGISNAILIKNLLISFNIPAETWQESAGISYGIITGPLGDAIIYVPESCLEDAQGIIKAYENNELSEPVDNTQPNEPLD